MGYGLWLVKESWKLAAALAINIVLFVALPVSQMLYDDDSTTAPPGNQRMRVTAEFVKPPVKPKTLKPRRSVRSTGQPKDRPLYSSMKLKLSPDLTVGGAGEGVAFKSDMLSAEVFDGSSVDKDVVPVRCEPPPYPSRAREMGIEGDVTVTFVVNCDGTVTVKRIEGPHPSFKEECAKIVSSWKFLPAVKAGVPVMRQMVQGFSFSLSR